MKANIVLVLNPILIVLIIYYNSIPVDKDCLIKL